MNIAVCLQFISHCRSLVKSLLGARRGVSPSGSMAYLSGQCDSRCGITGIVTIDALLKAYERRAIRYGSC